MLSELVSFKIRAVPVSYTADLTTAEDYQSITYLDCYISYRVSKKGRSQSAMICPDIRLLQRSVQCSINRNNLVAIRVFRYSAKLILYNLRYIRIRDCK